MVLSQSFCFYLQIKGLLPNLFHNLRLFNLALALKEIDIRADIFQRYCSGSSMFLVPSSAFGTCQGSSQFPVLLSLPLPLPVTKNQEPRTMNQLIATRLTFAGERALCV